MPTRRSRRGVAAATLIAVLLSGPILTTEQGSAPRPPGGDLAQEPAPVQTVCVLDFQRLGGDARADWLQRGLADMLIAVLHENRSFQVVEREHLRDLLREHALHPSGVIDLASAVRQAQLVNAQVLLLGSFAREEDLVTIQVRLLRVTDQRILAQVTWSDRYDHVLAAPRTVAASLLASLGHPVDPGASIPLEVRLPRTIDAAESYYGGLRAFDEGRYPEALAGYLDASRADPAFRKAGTAALELYYLLGRSEHAVLFARELARAAEERGNAVEAVEYLFTAARESLEPLGDPRSAAESARRLLQVIDRRERRTHEIVNTKRAVLRRIAELRRQRPAIDPDELRADREIRHRVWIADIDAELARRSEERARGGFAVLEGGRWVRRFAPEPSLLMWRIRARWLLAHAFARLGHAEASLDQYRDLLTDYEFIPTELVSRLLQSLRSEAHFMMLRHHSQTGQLIRGHAVNRLNRLNVVRNGEVFTRAFDSEAAPDPRARFASRGADRGHEYFDFAAPPGHQIASLRLRIDVQGIAEIGFHLPQPTGWPPRYSLSKRFDGVKYSTPGQYETTIAPPPGTDFLSVGTSWGSGLYSNTPLDLLRGLLFGSNHPDVVRWELSFVVSPKAATSATAAVPRELTPAPRPLLDRYAAGWERGHIITDERVLPSEEESRLDVFAEDWVVSSLNGDIRIAHQRDLALAILLPVSINSRELEFNPSLVRTHQGGFALLFARGTSPLAATRLIAFSKDLRSWDAPQALVFAAPAASLAYTYALAEPLERTYNVVRVNKGYRMLLAQGYMRSSEDLRSWGPPQKVLPQDLQRNRLLEGRDGAVWAVYETSSAERQPYTPDDWLHGFFVTGDKAYRHVTALKVSRSRDGVRWDATGEVVVAGQPTALWAFPIDERHLGLVAGFNNLYLRWFNTSSLGRLEAMDMDLRLPSHVEAAGDAVFFVHDTGLTCVRPVFDPASQRPVLLAATTERAFRSRTTP